MYVYAVADNRYDTITLIVCMECAEASYAITQPIRRLNVHLHLQKKSSSQLLFQRLFLQNEHYILMNTALTQLSAAYPQICIFNANTDNYFT